MLQGRIADAIVDAVRSRGGVMTHEDLSSHRSTSDAPIRTEYRGVDVWEMPPNGQGLTALLTLNILNGFDVSAMGLNSADHLHTLIEALRLAFEDTRW
jgi:gamma-glutamyltranspeptidase/glutathione hydrolase